MVDGVVKLLLYIYIVVGCWTPPLHEQLLKRNSDPILFVTLRLHAKGSEKGEASFALRHTVRHVLHRYKR